MFFTAYILILSFANSLKTELDYAQKDEEVEFYREKFAGSQADRNLKAETEARKITDQLHKAKISG